MPLPSPDEWDENFWATIRITTLVKRKKKRKRVIGFGPEHPGLSRPSRGHPRTLSAFVILAL